MVIVAISCRFVSCCNYLWFVHAGQCGRSCSRQQLGVPKTALSLHSDVQSRLSNPARDRKGLTVCDSWTKNLGGSCLFILPPNFGNESPVNFIRSSSVKALMGKMGGSSVVVFKHVRQVFDKQRRAPMRHFLWVWQIAKKLNKLTLKVLPILILGKS